MRCFDMFDQLPLLAPVTLTKLAVVSHGVAAQLNVPCSQCEGVFA